VTLLALAALSGYLVGSISFAWIIGRWVTGGDDLQVAQLRFHEGGGRVEVSGVSATSISVRAGRRWGLLVSLLDIGKAAVVTAVFRLLFPDEPAYLLAATFSVVGHIWPLWHRFRGGFGVSPMLGGLLVVDPVALLVVIPSGIGIGLLLADRLIAFDGWTLLLAPWFLLLRDDAAATLYGLVITAFYWWAMRVEVASHIERLRTGPRGWQARFADLRKGYTGDPRVG
jgi:acyl phosphate:glycerol-3-phosphate acyltransferase